MNTIELASFEEFEGRISAAPDDLNRRRIRSDMHLSNLLFRGRSKASWDLRTSLERYSRRRYSMKDYYSVMLRVRPGVESVTGRSWNLRSQFSDDVSCPRPPQGYEFMVYLRHHRFPSPLLDWTRSPYVAAFFAFEAPPDDDDDSVAVYSFLEYSEGAKSGQTDEATIVGCGPYLTTHKRHFVQQGEYTYCRKRVEEGYVYCCHEEAFLRNDAGQDVLTKYLMPRTERHKVMERLHLMNISAYSLFGDTENLLSTLAYEEIEK